MDRNQELLNDELENVAAGEYEEDGIKYYCNTCNKMVSYKASKEHKDKGHDVVKMWMPG